MRNSSSVGSVSYGSRQHEVDQDFMGIEGIRNLLKDGRTPEYVLTQLSTGESAQQKKPNDSEGQLELCRSVENLPTFVKQSEKVYLH